MSQLLPYQLKKDKKFLEQLSARFKRTIKSNKYRSEMND